MAASGDDGDDGDEDERQLAAALERSALLEHAQRAAATLRHRDWFVARPAEQPAVGLFNSGNTCYLNSLLQALFALDEVRRTIYAFDYDAAHHGPAAECVPLQLGELFVRLERSSCRAASTRALTASFGWGREEAFQQHDVQECMRVLFDHLARCGVGADDCFRGTLRSTLRCLRCGHERHRDEPFSALPLSAAGATLEACLAGFVAAERLAGADAWHCSATPLSALTRCAPRRES